MAETSAINESNKPSVVDDFFSALFANNSSEATPSTNAPTTTTTTATEDTTTTPQVKVDETTNNETVSNEESVLDEFDEYSMLSNQKQPDDDGSVDRSGAPSKISGDSPAQILAKRDIDWSTVTPESRMLVRQLPQNVDKQAIMDYFSKYGEVIEVVQKNSFGFVHFENPDDCARAVKAENGQYFNGVHLDLEICKRKPFFARAMEGKARRREFSSPPRRRSRSPPSRSRSPPRRRRRRNSPPPPRRGPRGRDYKNTINDRYDHTRRNDGFRRSPPPPRSYNQPEYRPNDYKQQPYNSYNRDLNKPSSLLPPRNGQNIPQVQIVSWSNAYRNFVSHVEGVLAHHSLRASSAFIQYSQSNRDEIIKQLVLEGVKALIIVDSANESKHKVYLQVFRANENGEGVRFDEYDSVTPNEAVTIIKSAQPQYQQYNQQQAYNPQQYVTPQQPPAPVGLPAGINANTLNVLYSMLQNNAAAAAPAATVQPPQPSIPQLIATLMSGLNMTSPQPAPVPIPQPVAYPKPDIAALLSTASNGNPAIAQLLYQMTAGTTNQAQPPASSQSTNQTQSEYTHSR